MVKHDYNGSLQCLFALKGVPKTGTTWMEVLTKAVLDFHCQLDAGCEHVPLHDGREFLM